MRMSLVAICFLLATSTAFAAQPIMIDAANGNTDLDVQAALDAHPPGTTFLMTGEFSFSASVHIEKSRTRILGHWIDENGDARPDENDTWNTTIAGVPNQYGFSEAFILMPEDEFNSAGYDVRQITISGIRFSGVNWPVSQHFFPAWDHQECRTEPLDYQLSDVRLRQNWLEGGGFHIYRNARRISIEENLFTRYQGQELFRHAVEMRGLTESAYQCGEPYAVSAPGQRDVTITGNIFRDDRDISVGTQQRLLVTDNVMTGDEESSYKLWISQASKATIRDNVFQTGPTGSGVLFWTRSNWADAPDTTSHDVDFINNTFVDNHNGLVVHGGTASTTIQGNRFTRSGDFGPVGNVAIVLMDVAKFSWGGIVAQPSSNVSIKHNEIHGAGVTAILLNGETTGASLINNTFSNPNALYGDVFLTHEDLVFDFGDALCPASDNTVVAGAQNTTIVVNGYSPRCEGSQSNKLVGAGVVEITP